MRFDRVLTFGAVFGQAFLTGRRKQHQDGFEFYLSDHFAVRAVLDVHSIYSSRAVSRSELFQRKAALGRLRDQAALLER